MTWQWFAFDQLPLRNLYQILHLRQQVFVVEQACAYEDIDGWDDRAVHLLGADDSDELVAYCRVFAPGVRFPEVNIGRVLTAARGRGMGLGHELIRRGKTYCGEHYPQAAIRIAGQAHLQTFYGSHGFVTEGAEYPVDDIPHVDMFLR